MTTKKKSIEITLPDKVDTWVQPQSTGIEIKKAKITNNQTLHVEYEERYSDNTHSDIKKDKDAIVHADLKAAFHKLIFHLIVLCDQKEAATLNEVKNPADVIWTDNKFSDYSVSGFSISGDDETEGVCIIGQKAIDVKVLNLVSPFESFVSDYKYSSDLAEAIEHCKYEVSEYLNGKAAVQQASFEFTEEESNG